MKLNSKIIVVSLLLLSISIIGLSIVNTNKSSGTNSNLLLTYLDESMGLKECDYAVNVKISYRDYKNKRRKGILKIPLNKEKSVTKAIKSISKAGFKINNIKPLSHYNNDILIALQDNASFALCGKDKRLYIFINPATNPAFMHIKTNKSD